MKPACVSLLLCVSLLSVLLPPAAAQFDLGALFGRAPPQLQQPPPAAPAFTLPAGSLPSTTPVTVPTNPAPAVGPFTLPAEFAPAVTPVPVAAGLQQIATDSLAGAAGAVQPAGAAAAAAAAPLAAAAAAAVASAPPAADAAEAAAAGAAGAAAPLAAATAAAAAPLAAAAADVGLGPGAPAAAGVIAPQGPPAPPCAVSNLPGYKCSLVLRPQVCTLHWVVNWVGSLGLALEVATPGWFSLAWSPTGLMAGSDAVVVFGPDAANNVPGRVATYKLQASLPGQQVPTNNFTISEASFTSVDNKSLIRFTRSPEDLGDVPWSLNGNTTLIYAYSTLGNDAFVYHGFNRGVVNVVFNSAPPTA